MATNESTAISERYHELTAKRSQRRKARARFVEERTRTLSEAHDDINRYFTKTDLREIVEQHGIGRTASAEKRAAMNEVLETVAASDEYQQLTDSIAEIEDQLDEFWQRVPDEIVDADLDKKTNIGRIWATLGADVPNDRAAEAVGCHAQYPGRLVLDAETETVDYKDHVKRRKNNQVRTEQRQAILERDGHACVRCGTAGDSLTIHHIDPVENDGSADQSNLATLCDDCHSKAHDAVGAGAVVYKKPERFWSWVRAGSRGFDPFQSTLGEF